MLQAVLFDLDGTLIDRARSLRDFVACQWASRPALQAVPVDTFVDAFIELDGHGTVGKDAVYAGLVERFGLTGVAVDDLLAQYVGEFSTHARLFPEVMPALAALRAKDLKLGIVTNGPTRLQTSVIAACGLVPLMETVVISEAEGVAKPDREIFRRALERLDVAAKRSVFVGDNPQADIDGARDAGMTPIWWESQHYRQPDGPAATLRRFKDLPEMVGQL